MSEANRLYIGLMSGTSVDSIDAALVEFSDNALNLIGTLDLPYEERTRKKIFDLTRPGENEIDRMGALDKQLGLLFAHAVNQLLVKTGYGAADICGIGSHGQTIRHRPRSAGTPDQFTLQIGDPNTIAQLTGITTVADFRRRDMAAGGQGAPLAPTFHNEMFTSKEESRCILNIGGMSNVTYIPKAGPVIGFDTGPGNVLMDAWISSFGSHNYDEDGAWAKQGTVNQELLQKLLSHSFFRMTAPKSTGREDFDISWVSSNIEQTMTPFSPQDVQATLTELTAISIANALAAICEDNTHVFVCGGGAHNTHLFERLKALMPRFKLDTTDALNLQPDWVEAVAFAWLAMRTLERKPGNIPAVTGASQELILGGVYYA
ncbi:anhydro-N-acetylmuramic acid kinase [Teredinibacter haidensis]|uniref:anhydro-N-acetylmuramic acid kinase n=1 Tax=Teredinibacter haidensis TaxID=2731755 RepID=UPI000948F3F5|nr:anhydro-N-acetylmuramic acid kinase [Teredinibacter haidensis]